MYLRGWDSTARKWGAYDEETREFTRYFESEEQARGAIRKVNRELEQATR